MTLEAGRIYTIKVKSARLFNLASESEVKERAALFLSGLAQVLSAERPLFTQYYLVRVIPNRNARETEITAFVRQSFHQLGMDNAAILDVEAGEKTTNIVKEAAGAAAQALSPLVSPFADRVRSVVIGVAAVVMGGAILYLVILRKVKA